MDQRDTGNHSAPPTLGIDWEAYLPFFEDADIPDDQKRALIEALWGIMTAFVDLGFGLHPVQLACGKPDGSLTKPVADMLSCDRSNPSQTTPVALQFGKAARKESE